MIPISHLFIDLDEQMIEDLTVCCYYKYGDAFLESLIPFFETGVITEMSKYYDSELTVLNEALSREDIDKIKSNVKDNLEAGKDFSKKVFGKRPDFRELTHRMSKNKVGRAIVKGIRKVAYGTKIGRKLVRKYADRVEKSADKDIKKAEKRGKEAIKRETKAHSMAKEFGKRPSKENILHGIRAKVSAGTEGMFAGSSVQNARKKLRQSHQLRRNAEFIKKKQREAKAYGTTLKGRKTRRMGGHGFAPA